MPAARKPPRVLGEPLRNRAGLHLQEDRTEVEHQIGGIGLDWSAVPATVAVDVDAADVWAHLSRTFAAQKVRFREGDRDSIESYCLAVALLRQSYRQLAKRGLTVQGRDLSEVRNPLLSTINMSLGHVRALGLTLGLSPKGRNMLGLADANDVPDRDELDLLFGGGGQ